MFKKCRKNVPMHVEHFTMFSFLLHRTTKSRAIVRAAGKRPIWELQSGMGCARLMRASVGGPLRETVQGNHHQTRTLSTTTQPTMDVGNPRPSTCQPAPRKPRSWQHSKRFKHELASLLRERFTDMRDPKIMMVETSHKTALTQAMVRGN